GIKVGVYYYTYALDKSYADKELDLVFSCLDGKSFEYPICVDIEDGSTAKLGRQVGTDLLIYQLETLQNKGYYASIYTYYAYQKSYLDMARLQGFDMAIACYTRECYYKGAYGIWQYSSSGSVPGIKGNCDLDFSYKDYAVIIKNAGLNGFDKLEEPPITEPPTTNQIEKLKAENEMLRQKLSNIHKESEI
ncbi:MAG: GH25 family lysozyme, partial [Oscillospiraceae bacterium]